MQSDARQTPLVSLTNRARTSVHTVSILKGPVFRLALLGIITCAAYALVFVRPFGLLQYWIYPGLTIAKITHGEPSVGIAFVLTIATLFGLYWQGSRIAQGRHNWQVWAVVITGAAAFCVVMLFQYTVDSTDVFDYIIRGRLQAFYGGNPYFQPPVQFSADPFFRYIGWKGNVANYGPLWELIERFTAGIAGDGLVSNVIAFKLVGLLGYAGTTAVIGLMLHRFAPDRALYGVLLFSWNPLVIYSIAGNGHNDAVMAFFVVLGFWFLAQRHFTLAALAETCGALIKFIPILFIPLILLAGLRQIKGRRAQLAYLLLTLGVCDLLGVFAYLPYWHGLGTLNLAEKTDLFTTSIPTLLLVTLEPSVPHAFAEWLVSRAALALLISWIARQLLRTRQKTRSNSGTPGDRIRWEPYVTAALSIVLFYLLVTCMWYQPWYAIWGVALAALIPDGVLARGSLLLSWSSLWKMPLFDYWITRNGLPTVAVREWPLTLGTLALPWGYLYFQSVRGLFVRRPSGVPREVERNPVTLQDAP